MLAEPNIHDINEFTGLAPAAAVRSTAGSEASRALWLIPAYIVLTLTVLLLYTANLDTIDLSTGETSAAVGTLALMGLLDDTASVTGSVTMPDSVIISLGQQLAFSFGGTNPGTARWMGMLGAVLLLLTPLLYRRWLSNGVVLIWSVVMAASPLVYLAARSADAMLWAAVGFSLAIGLLLHANARRRTPGDGAEAVASAQPTIDPRLLQLAVVIFVFTALTTGAGGLLWGITIVVALLITMFATFSRLTDENDTMPATWLDGLRRQFARVRLGTAMLLGAGAAFLAATAFMLHPQGVGIIGQALAGLVPTSFPTLATHPVMSSLVYDGLLLLLGIGALFTSSRLSAVWRTGITWLIMSSITVLLVLPHGGAMGLMLSLPLSLVVAQCIGMTALSRESDSVRPGFLWQPVEPAEAEVINAGQDEAMPFADRLVTVRTVFAVIFILLLSMLSLHWQTFARLLSSGIIAGAPASDVIATVFTATSGSFPRLRYALLWSIVSAVLVFSTWFIASVIWYGHLAWRSLSLALLGLMLVGSFGGAWMAVHSGNAAEPFFQSQQTVSSVYFDETLRDIEDRLGGFDDSIDIAVVTTDLTAQQRADLLWKLDDYPSLNWVTSVADARGTEVVITAATIENPDLGTGYVGQRFAQIDTWDERLIAPTNVLAWLAVREVPTVSIQHYNFILWLRQDVFNGTPDTGVTSP